MRETAKTWHNEVGKMVQERLELNLQGLPSPKTPEAMQSAIRKAEEQATIFEDLLQKPANIRSTL